MDLQYILSKYNDIIKEEVNVKDLAPFTENLNIKKLYIPIGRNISTKFWKDTWSIIKFAKQWKVESLGEGRIKVIWDWREWILDKDDYEIRYEWDIDEKTMAIDNNIVVRLDLNITDQLKKEWLAREISRYLNQLRKDAWYNINDRVYLYWNSDKDKNFWEEIFEGFEDFIKNEVLLLDISFTDSFEKMDIVKEFVSDDWKKIVFWLKKL